MARDYREGPDLNLSTSTDAEAINALWRATNPDALSPTPSPTFMREFNKRDLPDEVYEQHPDLVADAYAHAENDLQPDRVAEYIKTNPVEASGAGFDIEPAGRDYRDGPEMNLSTSADDPDINALWR